MVRSITAAKTLCAIVAITALSSLITIEHVQADSWRSTNKTLARINRKLAKVTKSLSAISTQIANQKQPIVTVPNINEPQTSPTQAPIGANQPSASYLIFDFYEGRTAEAIPYHNEAGFGVAFRIRENGVSGFAQEYKLNFSFADRTPAQQLADTFMLQTCLSHFHRAADAAGGGTFYINPNQDDKVGLLCTSVISK